MSFVCIPLHPLLNLQEHNRDALESVVVYYEEGRWQAAFHSLSKSYCTQRSLLFENQHIDAEIG